MKSSVHINQKIAELFVLQQPPKSSFSTRVSEIVDRYHYIIRSALPEFADSEWMAIFDANNGGPFPGTDPKLIAQTMGANVADSPELDEKWGVDRKRIAEKIMALTVPQGMALAEAARYFWDFCNRDADQLLQEIRGIDERK
jgi:hypothetical protein